MPTPNDLITNEDARDKLVDDAVAAVEDVFAQRGLTLTEEQDFSLGDYLDALLREVLQLQQWAK